MTDLSRYSCEEAFRRLEDFVDRELAEAEMQCVRRHLEMCGQCAHEFQFEEAVLREIRVKLPRIAAPPDLLRRIVQQLD